MGDKSLKSLYDQLEKIRKHPRLAPASKIVVGDVISPLPYQQQFVEDPSTTCVCLGGNSSGKTEAGAIKVARILKRKPPYPGCPLWVVGQSYELACGVCWGEKLTKHIRPGEIESISWLNRLRRWPSAVRFRNGWVIEFKSSEQGRGLFQARSIGGAWFDEQFPHEIYLEVFARTRDTRGQIIMTLTPIEPDPFLEEKFNATAPGWGFYKFLTRENTFVSSDWIDEFEREIPPDFRATRLAGEFGSFDGCVFKQFSRNRNVIPAMSPAELEEILKGKIVIRTIDFGFNNPFVCLWLYRDGDGVWTVFREWYKARTLISEHGKVIKNMSEGIKVTRTYADPEEAQGRAELADMGIPTDTPRKDVRSGIEEVQRLLMVMENGRTRLRITADCVNLIREMQMYRWGKPTASSSPDEPMKKDDHTCDALRYALFTEKAWEGKISIPRSFGSAFSVNSAFYGSQ